MAVHRCAQPNLVMFGPQKEGNFPAIVPFCRSFRKCRAHASSCLRSSGVAFLARGSVSATKRLPVQRFRRVAAQIRVTWFSSVDKNHSVVPEAHHPGVPRSSGARSETIDRRSRVCFLPSPHPHHHPVGVQEEPALEEGRRVGQGRRSVQGRHGDHRTEWGQPAGRGAAQVSVRV